MKHFTLLLAFSAAFATSAAAQSWTGPYLGAGLSTGNANTEALSGPVGSAPTYGGIDDSHNLEASGFIAVGGINVQNGDIVYGGEIGFNSSELAGDDNDRNGLTNRTEMSASAYVAGRVGYVLPVGMVYGSLGLASAEADIIGSFDPDDPPFDVTRVSHSGTRIAIGAEIPVGPGNLRIEAARTAYDAVAVTVPAIYDIQSKPTVDEINILYVIRLGGILK